MARNSFVFHFLLVQEVCIAHWFQFFFKVTLHYTTKYD